MARLGRLLAPLLENVASAFRSIRQLKLRSFLTCLGIILGVATVIVMVSVVEGFNQQFISSFEAFGATLVQFQRNEAGPGGPPREEERLRPVMTLEEARAIARHAWAIESVSPERWKLDGAEVRFRDRRTHDASVGGVTATYPETNTHPVTLGRFFTEAEERHGARVAVIGEGIVEALFPHLDPLGREISLRGVPFRVIGVFEEKGSFLGGGEANRHVVVPMGVFDRLFPEVARERGCVIATLPKKAEWVELAIEQGTQILREMRGLRFDEPNDFAVLNPERITRMFRQFTGGATAALVVIAGISLVIGGIGVMNIMLMNVTQRTREIGVRVAVGARRRDILQQFLTEAVTLTTAGGLAGVSAGVLVALLVGKVSPFPPQLSAWAVASGLFVAVLTGLVFGTYPAWRAARLDPIEALRYE